MKLMGEAVEEAGAVRLLYCCVSSCAGSSKELYCCRRWAGAVASCCCCCCSWKEEKKGLGWTYVGVLPPVAASAYVRIAVYKKSTSEHNELAFSFVAVSNKCAISAVDALPALDIANATKHQLWPRSLPSWP